MRVSQPEIEGVVQASKYLFCRALLDAKEMEALLRSLPPFSIYNVSELVDFQSGKLTQEDFLAKYIDYVATIKAGLIPNEKVFKPYFSASFSATSEALYAMKIQEGKYIIKPKEPVVQLSLHHFTYCFERQKFHSMIHSEESITWGIQFSFPQIYANSKTGDIIEVYKDKNNKNATLYKALSKWIRAYTTPTPFRIEGELRNATFRLGKESVAWAKHHPQLEAHRLSL